MRNFTFKGLFLTAVFMLLGCSSLYAADDDLITRQITIKLDKAGTLPNKIGSSEKYKITNLKIIGEINGTDLRMIRDMTGSDYNRKTTEGNLSVLDLSEAKIVKGGDYYYFRSYDRKRYYTFNNEIGDYTFDGCLNLTSLTLPYSTTKICSYAFSWCMGLTSLIIPSGVEYIGEEAFGNCSALSSLTIPSNVNEIGYKAFNNCSGLTILTLPSRLTKIADDTFSNCI